jgi:hypothetical protein
MLTINEREELEQMGAAAARAKLAAQSAGRRNLLDGFLQCSDPTRGDVEDWLGEQAKIEAAEQRRMMRAALRWTQIAAAASITAVLLIAWIAWRPESYTSVMDHIAAAIVYVVDAARGGLWRH